MIAWIDRRQDVADVERAGNLLVGHELPRAEHRGRRRERSNAQRVEEIGDESDEHVQSGSAMTGSWLPWAPAACFFRAIVHQDTA